MASSPLLIDFYQLSMLDVYLQKGIEGKASFEFFVRKMPENRNFLVAAGLEQALDYLTTLSFSNEDLDYLKDHGLSEAALDYLSSYSFKGDVFAMEEGEIFFENEPILRVEAPIAQAQLVETRLINIIHFQSLVASKASRVFLASRGLPLLDFGFRRSHEADAGLFAARACFIGGFSATATVEAGRRFAIPVTGTMAHSFVLAHESEEQAFKNFIEVHPSNPILLIDTFDAEKAALIVAKLFHSYKKQGVKIKGVRIDSGDYLSLSRRVRQIFDEKGCGELSIFVSGGLDEAEIERLLSQGAPIDGFGVGTLVDTSSDAPFLDCAYKLVEYEGRPCMKFSTGKATLPFRKQVFRIHDQDGFIKKDTLGTEDEDCPGTPLLKKVMEGGQVIRSCGVQQAQKRCLNRLSKLPERLRDLKSKEDFAPRLSGRLKKYLSKGQGESAL